jgi:hypothetical protein
VGGLEVKTSVVRGATVGIDELDAVAGGDFVEVWLVVRCCEGVG